MAVVSIASLKAKWITGYIPTQDDYVDLFDTLSNLQVILGASGDTGGQAVSSPDASAKLMVANGNIYAILTDGTIVSQLFIDYSQANIDFNNGSSEGHVHITPSNLEVGHTVAINIATPSIIMGSIPTTDPGGAGRVWNDGGFLKIT